MRIETFGALRAVVTGGDDGDGSGDGPIVVLLHGFGAPGDDLVPFGRVVAAPPGTRFVFPAAPIDLGHGFGMGESRAWWHIDMAALDAAMRAGRFRDLAADVPEGMPAARAAMLDALAAIEARLGSAPMVLGGFSQGAMLATDVALHSTRRLAGLVLLSGTLLAEREWTPRMAQRAGLPVFQSHGTHDPLLPFVGADALRERLEAAGATVDRVSFRGGHEIPPVVLQRLGLFVRRVLGGE